MKKLITKLIRCFNPDYEFSVFYNDDINMTVLYDNVFNKTYVYNFRNDTLTNTELITTTDYKDEFICKL